MSRGAGGARIAGPFADVLREGRERYNARAAMARRGGRPVDGARLGDVLVRLVDPIVRAVHAHDASRTRAVADALYDLALELVARDLAGGERANPAIAGALEVLGPALAPALSEDPRRVAAAIVNAAARVSSMQGASVRAWIDAMRAAAPHLGGAGAGAADPRAGIAGGREGGGALVTRAIDACVVAAWRAGVPMLRRAALAAIARLPERAAGALFGLGEGEARVPVRDAIARLEGDPFSSFERVLRGAAAAPAIAWWALGGFRGIGGSFLVPPTVEARGDRLIARAGPSAFVVWADRYGLALEPIAAVPAADTRAPALLRLEAGRVRGPGAELDAPLLADAVSVAAVERTLVAVRARSHFVIVCALAEST